MSGPTGIWTRRLPPAARQSLRITPEELQLIETCLHRRLDLDEDIRQ